MPLGCIPVLVPLAGAVNNDNLAFCGGAIAMLGVWQLLASGRESWLALALIGVVSAGWAKLTGLLLSAGLVSGVIAYMVWRKRLPWTPHLDRLGPARRPGVRLCLAAAPYFEFILRYGSPTPETPAQIALLTDGARAAGWSDLPRQSFAALSRLFHRRLRRRLDADTRRPQRPELRGARHPGGGAGLRSRSVSVYRCAGLWRRQETALDVDRRSPALWRSAQPSRSTSPIVTAAMSRLDG